jgi:preprotein translocase subunit Sec63
MSRRSFSIRYNPDKLRDMINEGKRAKEIMKEFKISPYTLKEHLRMLQEEDKKVYYVRGLFDDPEAEQPKSRDAGIVLSKELLKKGGFTPGDAIEVTVEDGKLILKKIQED